MKKDLIVALCSCFLLIGTNLSIQAQTEKPRPADFNEARSRTRGQEELKGPVRRVRVETVDILVKNGNFVEGPRVLREIATYDQKGIKIDLVSHAAEQTMPLGKQQYRHDDKGNIVELNIIGDDGSILSKVLYKYEFDELGNWKRKTSAIAVSENGVLTYEPIEISYRTITYYYAQAVDKLASAVTKAHASDSSVPTVSASNPPRSTMPASDTATTADSTLSARDEGARSIDFKITSIGTSELPAPVTTSEDRRVGDYRMAVKTEAPRPTSLANNPLASVEKPTLKRVSEETLRDAAINPPAPATAVAVSPSKPPIEHKNAKSDENLSAALSSASSPIPPAAAMTSESLKPAVTSLYETGVRYLEAGQHAEAVQALKQNVQLNPNDAISYVKLGKAYSALSQYKEVVVVLKAAIRIKPEVVDALGFYNLGNAYNELNRPADALEAFTRALYTTRAEAVNPVQERDTGVISLEYLHYNLGLSYHKLRRYDSAIKEWNEVVKLNPRAEAAYYGLGMAYLAQKNTTSARRQEAPLRSLNPALANKLKNAVNDAAVPSIPLSTLIPR